MADPDNFDDELFVDLYDDDEPQSSKPAPAHAVPQAQPKAAAAAAAATSVAPAAAPVSAHAQSAAHNEDYGNDSRVGGNNEYDDTMRDDYDDDDDDDVDFNLGNGSANIASNANNAGNENAGQRSEGTSQPSGGHYSDARSGGGQQRGSSYSKEDG